MPRFFADEDFSQPVTDVLRHLGPDVLTVKDIGRDNQRWPDDALFFFAIAQGRAILTKNRRHFYKLHREFPNRPGIIACTENPNFDEVASHIHQAVNKASTLTGQFIRIYQTNQSRP